jgi:hypothetical protein
VQHVHFLRVLCDVQWVVGVGRIIITLTSSFWDQGSIPYQTISFQVHIFRNVISRQES